MRAICFPGALEIVILEPLRRRPAAVAESKAGEGGVGRVSSTNRRVRTYQITAAGLSHLEQQIYSFERMFEGVSLVLNPHRAKTG
jgi:hypothetical protein